MAGDGAGTDPSLQALVDALTALAPGAAPEDWRDWAGGVPVEVLAKVAEKFVAQTEAGYAARLKEVGFSEAHIQEQMEKRKTDGNCPLFVFALVCKGWRKAQLKVGGPLRTRVMSDVLLPGRVALVKWVLAEGCLRDGKVEYLCTMAHCAACYGHRELVQWLCGEGGFAMDERLMGSAARGGNPGLVEWLRRAGCAWDKDACSAAAFFGRLEVLQWLRANGCPWDPKIVCIHAASHAAAAGLRAGGHLEVLRWIRDNGGELTEDLCMWAAGQGRLAALQDLRSVGCPWGTKTCDAAAMKGQLEILQWLHTNGCPWDFSTCFLAVTTGHVEVLRWARENGAPWLAFVRDRAAEELGYTDDFGNLVDLEGNPVQ